MLKTLASHIGEFVKDSLLTPLFMILEVILEMTIPLLMSSIIDDGVEKGDINHIYAVGALMVVVAAFGLLAGVMGGKYGARFRGFCEEPARGNVCQYTEIFV